MEGVDIHDGVTLFNYESEGEYDPMESMESDDDDSAAEAGVMDDRSSDLGDTQTFNADDGYSSVLGDDAEMKVALEVYKFCIKAKLTHESYRCLRRLSVFNDLQWLPLNFKDLKRKVARFVETLWGGTIHRVATIPTSNINKAVATPYLSITGCLRFWLSVPSILSKVRQGDDNRAIMPNQPPHKV